MAYDVDAQLNAAGGWSTFQVQYTWFVLAYPWAICGMQTLLFVFVTLKPESHRVCQGAGCMPEPAVFSCDDDIMVNDPASSILAEWNLRCDNAFLGPLTGSFFFGGFLLGVGCLGRICDQYGRRKTFYASLSWISLFSLWVPLFTSSYWWYAISRFMIGAGVGGLGISAYVLNTEILPAESRYVLVLSVNSFFAFGMMVTTALSTILSSWRLLSAAVGFAGIPMFAYMWLPLVESPKWYVTQACGDELAHSVITHIARVNNAPPIPPLKKGRISEEEEEPCFAEEERNPYKFLLRHPELRKRLLYMAAAWFACSLGYYGLSMDVSNLGSNIYVSSMLSTTVELPSYVVAMIVVEREGFGRRFTVGGCLLIGGMSCVVSSFFTGTAQLVVAIVGKFFMAAAFAVLYLYAAELFPTTLRSTALGLQSVSARIAGIMAPLIPELESVAPGMPLIIFGLPATFSGICLLRYLPETLGRQLPARATDICADTIVSQMVFGRPASSIVSEMMEPAFEKEPLPGRKAFDERPSC